jgi:protein-disulfide isomerase
MAKPVQAAKSTARRTVRKSAGRSNNSLVLWIIIGAAIVIVAGVIMLQSRALNQTPTVSGTVSDGLTWGPANAPVKIVEYSNFGCIHCRDFAKDQGKRLRQEYEATGKVRFEFVPFSLGSPDPDTAASAAMCAADQGRFWDYHDILFAKQGVSADAFSPAALKQYATMVPGMDTAKFDQCVDRGQHRDQVAQYATQGRDLGVEATPTFFINNQIVDPPGALPYDQLKAKVDAAIKG